MSTKQLIGCIYLTLVIGNAILMFTLVFMDEMGAAMICYYINAFFTVFGIGVYVGARLERSTLS
jgi:hypothetical protein